MPLSALIQIDHRRRPFIKGRVEGALRAAGIRISNKDPDFAVVVGGDGIFNHYLRQLKIPLLLVGIRDSSAVGTKAYLARTYLDRLQSALEAIASGNYGLEEKRGLGVKVAGKEFVTFTDVYLERGIDSNCLRYQLVVWERDRSFIDYAISNGVIVTTSLGSTGYYSALDKVCHGEGLAVENFQRIRDDEIGICHILPTFTQRKGSDLHPLRYTVPYGSEIEIKLVRKGNARLYGLNPGTRGIRVGIDDVVHIGPTDRTVKLINPKLR